MSNVTPIRQGRSQPAGPTFEVLSIEPHPKETIKRYHALAKGFRWQLKIPLVVAIREIIGSETKTVRFMEGHEFETGNVFKLMSYTTDTTIFPHSYPMMDDYGHFFDLNPDEAFIHGLSVADWMRYSDEVLKDTQRITSSERYVYR